MAIRVHDLAVVKGRINWVTDELSRKRLETEYLEEELSDLLKGHEKILTGQEYDGLRSKDC